MSALENFFFPQKHGEGSCLALPMLFFHSLSSFLFFPPFGSFDGGKEVPSFQLKPFFYAMTEFVTGMEMETVFHLSPHRRGTPWFLAQSSPPSFSTCPPPWKRYHNLCMSNPYFFCGFFFEKKQVLSNSYLQIVTQPSFCNGNATNRVPSSPK